MRILILINPNAGRQTFKNNAPLLANELSEYGHDVKLEQCLTKQSIEQAIAGDDGFSPHIVVCSGGDGTLNEMINVLMKAQKNIPIGYIPAGTTNDFARSLGIPRNIKTASRMIKDGKNMSIDVGIMQDRYFAYVASFGAFTQTSYSTPQNLKKSLGHLAYILEGLKELPTMRSYRVRVETPEEVFEGDYIFGAVTNSISLGGVIKLNRDGINFSDGQFELLLVRQPNNISEFSSMIFSMLSGIYDDSIITFRHIKCAKFICSEYMDWSLDGEHQQGSDVVQINNLQSAARILIK